MRCLHAAILGALIAGLGCSPGVETQVIVRVDADAAIRVRAASVRLSVFRDGESVPLVRTFALNGADAQLAFPFQQPLFPLEGDVTRRFHLVAELLDDADTPFARQAAIGGYEADRRRFVSLRFDESCSDLLCEETATCVEGRCVPACVAPVANLAEGRTAPTMCSRVRKPITVAATSDLLINFPLLVSVASDSDLATEARDDGADIGFTDAEGNVLDHELVRFVKATGELSAWVLVPRLSDGSPTTLYLHYGGEVVPENPFRVWQGYRGVWHLDEITTVTPDSSAANGSGQIAAGVESAEGQVAGALQTNSIGEALNLGDPVDGRLDFGPEDSFSLSVWVQFTELPAESQLIAFKGAARDGDPGYQLSANAGGTRFQYRVEDEQQQGVRLLVDGIATDVWYALALVLDRDRSELRAYRDGALVRAEPVGAAVAPESDRDLIVGSGPEPLRGLIDEIWIRESAPSDAWIAAEHDNQRDPASFVTVGSAERL